MGAAPFITYLSNLRTQHGNARPPQSEYVCEIMRTRLRDTADRHDESENFLFY